MSYLVTIFVDNFDGFMCYPFHVMAKGSITVVVELIWVGSEVLNIQPCNCTPTTLLDSIHCALICIRRCINAREVPFTCIWKNHDQHVRNGIRPVRRSTRRKIRTNHSCTVAVCLKLSCHILSGAIISLQLCSGNGYG